MGIDVVVVITERAFIHGYWNITPVRKQYLQIKAQHPDAIVLFRLGDFYETFDQDAETAARELDLMLTSRPVAKNQRVPMAGVPYHAVEGYIARLIEKGYRVAIAEQVGEVTGRGLDADTVRVFRLGFAAGRLKRYLAFRGWSEELTVDGSTELAEVLGLVDSHGREWYRGRLVVLEVRGERAIYLMGCTVLVSEEMKDVGDLAEKAVSPAQTFARLVGEAR